MGTYCTATWIALGAVKVRVLGALPLDVSVRTPFTTLALMDVPTPGSAFTTSAYAPPVDGWMSTLYGVHTLTDVKGCRGVVWDWAVTAAAVAAINASITHAIFISAAQYDSGACCVGIVAESRKQSWNEGATPGMADD